MAVEVMALVADLVAISCVGTTDIDAYMNIARLGR